MYRCPVCGEFVEELTKYHCMTKHQMSKEEVIEKYGKPEFAFTSQASRNASSWNVVPFEQR